jgi:asparagine synthase (glutamine-hydrolysing)
VGAKLIKVLGYGGDYAGAYFVERGLFSKVEARALLAPELAGAVEAVDPHDELLCRLDVDALPEDERVSALEMRQYMQVQLLRDADAVSMAHSLELRTPLVDRDLLRAAARVPARLRRAGPAKLHLRQAPHPPLPPALWQRRKQGFTLPFEHWLRSGGIPRNLPERACLNPRAVQAVARDFDRGRVHWTRLWALIVLREFLG